MTTGSEGVLEGSLGGLWLAVCGWASWRESAPVVSTKGPGSEWTSEEEEEEEDDEEDEEEEGIGGSGGRCEGGEGIVKEGEEDEDVVAVVVKEGGASGDPGAESFAVMIAFLLMPRTVPLTSRDLLFFFRSSLGEDCGGIRQTARRVRG